MFWTRRLRSAVKSLLARLSGRESYRPERRYMRGGSR